MDVWHRRLSHLNERAIQEMADKGMVEGIAITEGSRLSQCEGCIVGKFTLSYNKDAQQKETIKNRKIYTDT